MRRTKDIGLNTSLDILIEPNYHSMLDLFESKLIPERDIKRRLKGQYKTCPTSLVFGRALISYGLWFATKNPKSDTEEQRGYCAKIVRNVYDFSRKLIHSEELRKQEIRKATGRLYSLSAEEIIGRINGRNNSTTASGRARPGNLPRSNGVNIPPIFTKYGYTREIGARTFRREEDGDFGYMREA